jgi:hypothetical protein
LTAEPVQRDVGPSVAVRLHHDERGGGTDRVEETGHPMGLPQGQR